MNISPIFFKRVFNFSTILLLTLISTSVLRAQPNGVDPTFNPLPFKDTVQGLFGDLTVQPDGKVIVFGNFFTINGVIKPRIARLNADGTLDNSFNCGQACEFNIFSVVVQPDGKILIAGSAASFSPPQIARLNSDGSLDTTFTSPYQFGGGGDNSASVLAVQADGKIYIAQTTVTSVIGTLLRRLNPDGSFDNTFNQLFFNTSNNGEVFRKLLLLPDGKLLIAGKHSFGFVFRVNPNGTRDASFDSPLLDYSPPQSVSARANDVVIQPDGKIVFTGGFNRANGIMRDGFARLNLDGSIDTTFNPTISASAIEIQPGGGKIIAQTNTTLRRLNDDGSIDNTFNQPASLEISRWAFDAAGNILFFGRLSGGEFFYGRLNGADGSLDSSFNNATVRTGEPGKVFAAAVQPDNKILIHGDFTRVNNQPKSNFARLNPDGSLDPTFDAGTGFNNTVETIVVQADGKILVGGSFTQYNGTERSLIARLNADGSLDASFSPGFTFNQGATGRVATIAVQPGDAKIYIGGNFIGVNNQFRTGIARLNADGTLDAGFNPAFSVDQILSIVIQPDGKIMVGGAFNGVNGFNRTHLARLNPDGTLDTSFNAGSIPPVRQVEQQADGKYVALFFNPDRIGRLNNDGTNDASFQQTSFNERINRFVLQPDGSVIVVGRFTSINNTPRLRIARLKPDGTLDTAFFVNGANNEIRTIVKQADNRLIVGGDFTAIGNFMRFGVARLIANTFQPPTRFDFDGDGRADIAVFRPSNGFWYQLNSQNNTFAATRFGVASDLIAPADYDGDGRTDIAVFRDTVPGAGNFAYFYILNSTNNAFVPVQFGATGDVPVSGDWDGDGKADLAVYRDGSLAGGQSNFYYRPSSQPGTNFRTIKWGATGDKPLVGDFDGDGKLDAAVFRPSTATWYILQSSNGQVIQTNFGLSTDIPTPADFDGDGRANIAVFRPSTGTWFTSINPANNYGAIQFGASGDLPVPADYDGDGRTDVAVFRPSNGAWYLNRSTSGFAGVSFGSAEDKPIPNAYIR